MDFNLEKRFLMLIMYFLFTVRAAFGIYNFEFRNKKIGFNIPDELLLQYLAQRHDLTNFVIEIGQGKFFFMITSLFVFINHSVVMKLLYLRQDLYYILRRESTYKLF